MIPPRLEADALAGNVIGMFCFEDNNGVLVTGDPLGERLACVAQAHGILLMGYDQCGYERQIHDKLVNGAVIGCFANRY